MYATRLHVTVMMCWHHPSLDILHLRLSHALGTRSPLFYCMDCTRCLSVWTEYFVSSFGQLLMRLLCKFLSRCLCFCFGPCDVGTVNFIRNSKAVFESAGCILSYSWNSRYSASVPTLGTVKCLPCFNSAYICTEVCHYSVKDIQNPSHVFI